MKTKKNSNDNKKREIASIAVNADTQYVPSSYFLIITSLGLGQHGCAPFLLLVT